VLSVYRAPLAGAAVADVELIAEAAAGGYLTRRGISFSPGRPTPEPY